jgi:hypothetical protein
MIVAIVDVLTSFIFIFTNDNHYRANYSYYHLIVARYICFSLLYTTSYIPSFTPLPRPCCSFRLVVVVYCTRYSILHNDYIARFLCYSL